MREITLASYAKVNLTLEVCDRRADGFHDIDSVVQVIDIRDEITVREAPDGVIEVTTDAPGVPSGPGNLVYKACEAFIRATGLRVGARFDLRKRIPAQAGLGGGSGNAAAAVASMDRLYECGLGEAELARIAASVGSDAALFITGGTVRMRGRGDLIDPLPDAPEMHIVVVRPDTGVSTAWAYAELDRRGHRPSSAASDLAEKAVRAGDKQALLRALSNDFDAVVCETLAEVRWAKDSLLDCGARAALLAGSGSAVFGVFGSASLAEDAAEQLRDSFPYALATHGLTRRESRLVEV